MNGTLTEINALAHRWHRDMEQLANGHNGERKVIDDATEADDLLEKAWQRYRAALAVEHGRSIPKWMLNRPYPNEGYVNEPIHVGPVS